jgi:membrane fusion protein, multidrug efflux system
MRKDAPKMEGPMAAAVSDVKEVAKEKGGAAPAKRPARAKVVLAGLVSAALLGGGGYHLATMGTESTDDAFVEGRVMNVAARVQGQVAKVLVQDNQVVEAGQVLVELDAEEIQARAAVARADLLAAQATLANAKTQLELTDRNADATLRQARGGLTQAVSSVSASRSSIDQAQADIAAAESRVSFAQTDLQRVAKLRAENAVPQADLDAKQAAFDQAKASLDQARARLESVRASLTGSAGGVALAEGRLAAAQTAPQQVQAARAAVDLADARAKQAEAALRLAELNVSYTQIKAPTKGAVSRRTVEVGQMVSPERPLMALVPLDDVWIVANFKEDQLAEMRAGEPAKIEVDTYGGRVARGHVDSVAGASGARFALLPPDNASGNFIKVVQRIPVLVKIDEAAGMTLRPGMSVEVTVDTRKH